MSEGAETVIGRLGGVTPVREDWEPLSEAELAAIEREIGATLPDDYREFVSRYGFATFGELVQFPALQPLPGSVSESGFAPFSHFYGPASAGPNGLAKVIKRLRGRMPDSVIPIAADGGGSQIVLAVTGGVRGEVYYWDVSHEWDRDEYEEEHGRAMPEEAKFSNMYLVANSFTDFLGRLVVTPEAE